MMDVVVVGSCMTDLVSYASRLPKVGETLHGDRFSIGFGGKGANQCVVAARLGAKTAMVARVGDDSFGHNYITNFKDNNVNIDHVGVTPGTSTGVAQITVDKEGNNAIVITSGANLLLSESDLSKAESIIKSAKVLVCQLEIQPQSTLAAMKLANTYGVTTIFNPAPATQNLDAELYTACDIFCPNETETELLIGKPVLSVKDAEDATLTLLAKGCKSVVITLGENGCVYASKDQPCIHIPTPKVKPVDSTGAGDAFVGALAFYLSSDSLKHLDYKEKLRRSCEIASISVQAPGTQTSYPWGKDLPQELFQ